MDSMLYNHFALVADFQANEPCFILEDDTIVSYGKLFETVDKITRVLFDLDIEVNGRILVHCEKSWYCIALYLASLRHGAIYVPVNDAYTAEELDYFVNDSRPSLYVGSSLLGSDRANDTIKQFTLIANNTGTFVDRVEASTGLKGLLHSPKRGQETAAILYTSGTTGKSKGAELTYNNLHSNSMALNSLWGIEKEDTLLHMLPIHHVHGLFVAINCVLLRGGKMYFERKFDMDRLLARMPTSTVFMGVPTHYTRMLADERFTRSSVESMRLFISGSAPLSTQTFEEFKSRTGMTILERYGMTETLMNTSNPLEGERKAGTVGFPIGDVELRIMSNEGEELGPDEVGSIEVRGTNVFSGYWARPEATASEFTEDGYFKTGDMGFKDESGRVTIVGREKDLVISGGLNVYPAEVESAIRDMKQVQDVAVIGVPHHDFGEGVVAVVVLEDGFELTVEQVGEYLQDKLAGFKRPKAIVPVDELPYNTMGKVQKNVLRETHQDLFKQET